MSQKFALEIKASGRTLRRYTIGGEELVGVHGREPYAVVLRNSTGARIEARITIDGKDVLTGEPGTLAPEGKRWVVAPYGSLELKAWPESREGGAAFVFADAGQSVSAHTGGDASHLGIIAAAVFVEGAPAPAYRGSGDALRSFRQESGGPATYGGAMRGGEAFSYGDAPVMRGGSARSTGPGTGAGSHTEQHIGATEGLRAPRLEQVLAVRYVWADDLAALLAKREAPPTFVAGFPGARPDEWPGIALGSTPRIATSDPRFAD